MRTQVFTALAFLASIAVASQAATKSKLIGRSEAAVDNFVLAPEVAGPLALFFDAIESIPENVLLAGDDETNVWLIANGFREAGTEVVTRSEVPSADWLHERAVAAAQASIIKIAKCVAAVAELIISTAVPAAKILRIKKLIDRLGGTRKAVELLLKATSRSERLKIGGQILLDLVDELSGIKNVREKCF
jgi:hypothetical protein